MMRTQMVRTGITRNVLLWRMYAIKFPKSIRGWLGNQSEWRQRKRLRVNRPYFTLFHFVTVYPRAVYVPREGESHLILHNLGDIEDVFEGDEAKVSSWGMFSDSQYRLIDYDRAWENPRGVICRIYYWNQARLARKWMKLDGQTQQGEKATQS